jgi:hypothetical protein
MNGWILYFSMFFIFLQIGISIIVTIKDQLDMIILANKYEKEKMLFSDKDYCDALKELNIEFPGTIT